MSSYDESLDELVHDIGPIEGTNLVVQVRSYDGGPPKLRVRRVWTTGKGVEKSRSLGSFTLDEARALGIALQVQSKPGGALHLPEEV
jgi:hypothetical protein